MHEYASGQHATQSHQLRLLCRTSLDMQRCRHVGKGAVWVCGGTQEWLQQRAVVAVEFSAPLQGLGAGAREHSCCERCVQLGCQRARVSTCETELSLKSMQRTDISCMF